MWRIPVAVDNPATYNMMMPGAQELQVTDKNNISQQEEIMTNKLQQVSDATYTSITVKPRVSCPRLHMGQPKVPDETGMMKFRYAIQMSAETHVLFHPYPDMRNFSKVFWL